MKLSHQAMGAVMLALQQAIMEQENIVPILEGFDFDYDDNQGLIVINPPTPGIPDEVADKIEDEVDA